MGLEAFSDGGCRVTDRYNDSTVWQRLWPSFDDMIREISWWNMNDPKGPGFRRDQSVEVNNNYLQPLETSEKAGFWKRWWHRLYLHEGPLGMDYRFPMILLPCLAIALTLVSIFANYASLRYLLASLGGAFACVVTVAGMLWHAHRRALAELVRRRQLLKEATDNTNNVLSSYVVAQYLRKEAAIVFDRKLPSTVTLKDELCSTRLGITKLSQGTGISLILETHSGLTGVDIIIVELDEVRTALKLVVEKLANELDGNGRVCPFEGLTARFEHLNEVFELLYAAARIIANSGQPRSLKNLIDCDDWKTLKGRLGLLDA